MTAILPITFAFMVFITLYRKIQKSFEEAFIISAITFGVAITLSTEVFSIINSLNENVLFLFWTASNASVVVLYFSMPRLPKEKSTEIFISKGEWIVLSCIFLICTLIGIIALISPPTNWDSMTYHLSRVMHWQQNENVNHYSTHIIRQLTYTPWAEFAILHFQILSQSDVFANLIQYFSMIGSLIVVYAISGLLKVSKLGRLFSSLLVVTIPMGILQASSTQNDYVLSFWFIIFTYFALKLIKSYDHFDMLMFSISCSLALLTKGTAYIYTLPIFIVLFIVYLKRNVVQGLFMVVVLSVSILTINGGYFYRNYQLTQHVLPSKESPQVKMEDIKLKYFASNFVRNLSLHLGTEIRQMNTAFEKCIAQIHKRMAINILDDNTTFGATSFSIDRSIFEETSGNFRHTLLFLFATLLVFFRRKKDEEGLLTTIWFTAVLGFLIFSVLLKWQPWHSRLHLSLFVLSAPFIVGLFDRQFGKKVIVTISLLMFFMSMPWLLKNQSRRLISSKRTIFSAPRVDNYFANRLDMIDPYKEITKLVSNSSCTDIGLVLSADGWEYPFWPLLSFDGKQRIIEHIDVKNISNIYDKDFKPCMVISDGKWSNQIQHYNHTKYQKSHQKSSLNLYKSM